MVLSMVLSICLRCPVCLCPLHRLERRMLERNSADGQKDKNEARGEGTNRKVSRKIMRGRRKWLGPWVASI